MILPPQIIVYRATGAETFVRRGFAPGETSIRPQVDPCPMGCYRSNPCVASNNYKCYYDRNDPSKWFCRERCSI